jgi:hypothetical protein
MHRSVRRKGVQSTFPETQPFSAIACEPDESRGGDRASAGTRPLRKWVVKSPNRDADALLAVLRHESDHVT